MLVYLFTFVNVAFGKFSRAMSSLIGVGKCCIAEFLGSRVACSCGRGVGEVGGRSCSVPVSCADVSFFVPLSVSGMTVGYDRGVTGDVPFTGGLGGSSVCCLPMSGRIRGCVGRIFGLGLGLSGKVTVFSTAKEVSPCCVSAAGSGCLCGYVFMSKRTLEVGLLGARRGHFPLSVSISFIGEGTQFVGLFFVIGIGSCSAVVSM